MYKFSKIIIILLFLISLKPALADDFKIIFDFKSGTSRSYNRSDITSIDFDSLEKEYSIIFYKKDGNSEHTTSEISEIQFFTDHMAFSDIENNNYIYQFNLIDSIKFIRKTEIKEFQLGEVILSGLSNPWSLAFIDSENLLFTEREGKLFHLNLKSKKKTEISGLPKVYTGGQGGLLDVKLHPDFKENQLIYFSYARSVGSNQTTAVMKAKLSEFKLSDTSEIFLALPPVNSGVHFGSRLLFDNQNYLYISVGERGTSTNAQDSSRHLGKIIRLKDDGKIPEDNPFIGRSGVRPEIWSMGHRNIQGMALHPVTGEVWAHEHGPKGGDELNLIVKGANYAWPLATFGINYNGTEITKDTTYPGCTDPITYWVPSIAPCGMTFLETGTISNESDILIGALAGEHIHRLHLQDNKVIAAVKSLQGYARFRDVKQSPDGSIFAVTEQPGSLIKIIAK